MKYEFLTEDEQDDAIAEALYEREKEHFHYALNVANFEDILASLPPEASLWTVGKNNEPYTMYLARLIAEHQTEMAKVEKTHGALSKQLPAGARRNAAAQRVATKRAARAVS